VRILMLGDVIGRPGREAVSRYLPSMVEEYEPDFVLANGENLAGGLGITQETALPLFDFGVDVITLGNHVWAQRQSENFIAAEPRVVRPANLPPDVPGRGFGVFRTRSGQQVGVVNLLGRIFMNPVDDPFRTADKIISCLKTDTPIIVVDFHAEATSEKAALAWDLDGRVSAVLGTHTHVQTSDERLLPKGTAFITDVGMVGPYDSILGLSPGVVINNFRLQMKPKVEIASGQAIVCGVLIDVEDDSGRAVGISRLSIIEKRGE